MSLRSKLGLSLASVALGTALACGPKPEIKDNIFDFSTHIAHLAGIPLQRENPTILYHGRISEGTVFMVHSKARITPAKRFQIQSILYTEYIPDQGNESYIFQDADYSGSLGDNFRDHGAILDKEPINLRTIHGIGYLIDSNNHVDYEEGPPSLTDRQPDTTRYSIVYGPLANNLIDSSRDLL